ncbi:MAG: chemotaxis protein [Rhodobacteraceae bacterium PARR1]|nr:MAG: chemotaxis protein [Rhodobacteraceae bacterium PARR1]
MLREKRPRLGLDPALGLTDAEFAAMAHRIHRDTGIVIGVAKRNMLISRLAHRLADLGLPDFAAYMRLLDSPGGADERRALISAITTNVTRFFREPHHFTALAGIAPALAARARAGARIRLWSAGCSTGQEAFSIAATLLDHDPALDRCDLRILATDIDEEVIETARRGIYDRRSIGPEAPPALHRFLADGPEGHQVRIAPKLHALIRFETLNLLEPWPFHGQFDIVFCRNVVIYFDPETRHVLWRRLAGRIVAEGRLFLGHSERMDPRLDALFAPCGITQYRRTAIATPDDAGPVLPFAPLAPRPPLQ